MVWETNYLNSVNVLVYHLWHKEWCFWTLTHFPSEWKSFQWITTRSKATLAKPTTRRVLDIPLFFSLTIHYFFTLPPGMYIVKYWLYWLLNHNTATTMTSNSTPSPPPNNNNNNNNHPFIPINQYRQQIGARSITKAGRLTTTPPSMGWLGQSPCLLNLFFAMSEFLFRFGRCWVAAVAHTFF